MKKIENKLKKLEGDLNSIIYKNMIEVTMRNWRHVIKDNSIYKVNEILKDKIKKQEEKGTGDAVGYGTEAA